MKKSILFGERIGKKDPNNPEDYGWTTLYDSRKKNPRLEKTTLLEKKSIVFFPGDGVDSEQQANGCCSAMEKMLILAGVPQKDRPHFFGLAYQQSEQDKHRYQVLEQLNQIQFGIEPISEQSPQEQPYYQPFFDEYILPLIVNESGKPRPVSEIKKNIQNITFASHCHGGFVAYQIEKMMAQKLTEFYPQQMPDLMSNIRMIHFSSRRPKGQISYGKHLDIISQNDEMFADEAFLEYDDIHKQLQRTPLTEPTALIHVSPNEEILLFKKLTTEISDTYGDNPDHSCILQIFSGEYNNTIPENVPAIQLTRQMLRHFVEHPEDKKDIETGLKELDSDFVQKNIESGASFVQEAKQGKIRRELLSLTIDWIKNLGARLDRRKKHYKKTYQKTTFDAKRNDLLRERDTDGHFLYEELKKQYQQTGDPLSLIHYIKDTANRLRPSQRGDLAILALQQKNWGLFNALGGKKGTMFYVEPDQLKKILTLIQPDDLYRLLPALNNLQQLLKQSPELMTLLMRKTKKVKQIIHKKQLEAFFQKILRNIFHLHQSTLQALLQQASSKENKNIKVLLANERKEKANELRAFMRDRDTNAPELSLQEVIAVQNSLSQKHATLKDFSEFKAQQQDNESLTFNAFMANKRKSK